jgi:transcriptional regulator with XRE-family HTH domain
MQLGDVIRTLRGASGLSQQELARQLEITPSYLSLIERNRREPTITVLRRIADGLGTPAALLLAAALTAPLDGERHATEVEVVDRLVEAARMLIVLGRTTGECVPSPEHSHGTPS